MKKLISLKKILKFSASTFSISEDSGFLVVDSKKSSFLNLLYMNQMLKDFLGYNDEDIKSFNIKQLMPKLI